MHDTRTRTIQRLIHVNRNITCKISNYVIVIYVRNVNEYYIYIY